MSFLAALCLHLLHFVYSTLSAILALWNRLTRKPPLPLTANRAKVPNHLAIILDFEAGATEAEVLENVSCTLQWCRAAGIVNLTLFDGKGVLLSFVQQIRDHVARLYPLASDSAESDLEYPLTPPPSDYSASRPMSPEMSLKADLHVDTIHVSGRLPTKRTKTRKNVLHKRRPKAIKNIKPLTLYLVSPKTSRPAFASLARSFVKLHRTVTSATKACDEFSLSTEQLQLLLEGEQGFPPPDLIIAPPRSADCMPELPLELHGFPPWQARLTEISRGLSRSRTHRFSPPSSENYLPLLSECTIRQALDEFAGAEMRLGK